jgi:hypothetical protein
MAQTQLESTRTTGPDQRPAPPARAGIRAAGVVGLLAVAVVHLMDVSSKFSETPYQGWLFVGLIIGCLGAAALIAARDDRRAWLAGAALCGATFIAFCISRSVGLPAATEDIGNWTETIGMVSVISEGIFVLLALGRLKSES